MRARVTVRPNSDHTDKKGQLIAVRDMMRLLTKVMIGNLGELAIIDSFRAGTNKQTKRYSKNLKLVE